MASDHSDYKKNNNSDYKNINRKEWNQQPDDDSYSSDLDYLTKLFEQEPQIDIVPSEGIAYSTSLPSPEEFSEVFFNEDLWDSSLNTDISILQGKQTKTEVDELINLFDEEDLPPYFLEADDDEIASSQNVVILETEGSIIFDAPSASDYEETFFERSLQPCLSLYGSLAEIERLIEQPAKSYQQKQVDYEALEKLINLPAAKVSSEDLILSEVHIVDHSELFNFNEIPTLVVEESGKQTSIEDDPFNDLEELLKQTERTMKGVAASPTIIGNRQSARVLGNKGKSFEQTMRVPIKQLDNLSNLIGELVIKRNSLEQDQERMQQFVDSLLNQVQALGDLGTQMQELYEGSLLENALATSRKVTGGGNKGGGGERNNYKNITAADSSSHHSNHNDLGALELDRFSDFHLIAQEMMEVVVRVRESTSDIQFLVGSSEQVSRSLRQVTTQLQEGMTKSRMVAFGPIAERFSRAVKNISMSLNKQAKLQVDGKEVLIDKMILEHLYDPMTHLVNNAMTHGIESTEERVKKGKSAEGHIIVRAFLQGNQTVIVVEDDGAGINPEIIKKKAVEKGLLTPEEAKSIKKQELYDILFHPGFTTKDKADQYSGRGVGLDVVRTALSDIRGSVSIDSEINKGTSFTIRLPFALSICKAICCVSDYARIAFPTDGVEDMKEYATTDIVTNKLGQKCVPWKNNTILLPYQPLSALLSFNRANRRSSVYGGKIDDDTVSIVILRSAGNLLAVQVDRVLGEQEIVIKQIEGPIPKPIGIAGATVLGDGSIMPIGDVLELVEISQGRSRVENLNSMWQKTLNNEAKTTQNREKTDPIVLIVDDSITVRELLSSSFIKAGYRVEQARDGQEAWDKLRSGLSCDLIFCDIEMPRMNGLDLLANIQKDEKFSKIPVALLTSRAAEKHRSVAAKYGASGYFVKPYTEKDILDAADRIIHGEVLLPASSRLARTNKPIEASDLESKPPTGQNARLAKTGNCILVIDDSAMIRAMLSTTLAKGGYQSIEARDGQDAWEKLRAGLNCDLILCDIEMPRMNGLELLSRLQEDRELSIIPIAMITSRGAQKMKTLAAERGAKGYFVKPYIEEELLDATKRLISGEVLLDSSNVND